MQKNKQTKKNPQILLNHLTKVMVENYFLIGYSILIELNCNEVL